MNSLKKRYHYYRFFFNTRKLRKNFPFYKVATLEETIDEIRIHKKISADSETVNSVWCWMLQVLVFRMAVLR